VNPARLTLVADVLRPVEGALRGVAVQQDAGVESRVVIAGGGGAVAAAVGGVGGERHAHALLPQVAHEELQADEGEDAEAEDGEDHDVRQLLHGLDERAHDGLQA